MAVISVTAPTARDTRDANDIKGLGDAVLVVTICLMAIGVVMVASTTASLDHPLIGPAFWRTAFGRQLCFVTAGLLLMVATARISASALSRPAFCGRIAVILYALAALSLAAAFIPGLADPRHGSHRWIRIGPPELAIRYQPSELAKVALVVMLAWLLTRRGSDPTSLKRGFLPSAAAIGFLVLIVGGQDFGTAALLGAVGVVILFVAGCSKRHLMALTLCGASVLTGLVVAFPYRLARIWAFQNYWDDPQGRGYQAVQSLAAIASGGLFGRGLGAGVQKYGYVPAGHSDFIFAIICEETGLLGAGLVIALFAALIWLGLRISLAAESPFARLLAIGITCVIALQAGMNIAVVSVVAPTKGISLPLISAGGSGILTACSAIGIIAGVAKNGEFRAKNGV